MIIFSQNRNSKQLELGSNAYLFINHTHCKTGLGCDDRSHYDFVVDAHGGQSHSSCAGERVFRVPENVIIFFYQNEGVSIKASRAASIVTGDLKPKVILFSNEVCSDYQLSKVNKSSSLTPEENRQQRRLKPTYYDILDFTSQHTQNYMDHKHGNTSQYSEITTYKDIVTIRNRTWSRNPYFSEIIHQLRKFSRKSVILVHASFCRAGQRWLNDHEPRKTNIQKLRAIHHDKWIPNVKQINDGNRFRALFSQQYAARIDRKLEYY